MAEIRTDHLTDEDFVQHARLHIPVDNPDEVRRAFEVIAALRKRALDHLDLKDNEEDGAVDDYVAVDFKEVDGTVAILEVMMVSL